MSAAAAGDRFPDCVAGMIWRVGCTRGSFLNSGSRAGFGRGGCGLGGSAGFPRVSASRTSSISYHSNRQHDHGEAKSTWRRQSESETYRQQAGHSCHSSARLRMPDFYSLGFRVPASPHATILSASIDGISFRGSVTYAAQTTKPRRATSAEI
jgi:hypothetical protein